MYEGSITPPLSDEENWDCDDSSHFDRSKSPVLQTKKMRLENDCIFHVQNKKSRQVNVEDMFYKVRVNLLQLETSFTVHHTHIPGCDLQAERMFEEIQLHVEECLKSANSDAIQPLFKQLLALSNEVSIVLDHGIDFYSQEVAGKRLFSDKHLFHNCSNPNLVGWFHSYCLINTMMLNVAEKVSKLDMNESDLQIHNSNGTPVCESGGVLTKAVARVVHELALLSANIFKKSVAGNLTLENTLKTVSTPCSCFSDLLAMCSSLSLHSKESFWSIITSVVNSVIQASSRLVGSSVHHTEVVFDDVTTALSFCWWWLRDMPFEREIPCCHSLVSRLMRLSISHCVANEQVFLVHLLCYRAAIMTLQSSMDGDGWQASELASFNLLWRTMSQRLCLSTAKVKSESKNGIRQYMTNHSSTQEWLEECNNLQTLASTQATSESLDSFKALLIILELLLKKDQGFIWLQLKDRFFVRIPGSSMKKITEVGLHRYFLLCFVILKSCPLNVLEETLSECIALLEQCVIDRLDFRKAEYVSSGLYGFMTICVERNMSYKHAAIKVGKLFERTCRMTCDKSLKAEHWHESHKLLLHHLNSLSQLLLTSPFSSNQNLLLPPGCLKESLACLRSNNIDPILSFLLSLFSYLSSSLVSCPLPEKEFMTFCAEATKQVLPFLKKEAISPSCNHHDKLCDVISEATLLWMSLEEKFPSEHRLFSDIWTFFACDGQLDNWLRLQYLNCCFENIHLPSFLNSQFAAACENRRSCRSSSDVAVQGWIKCSCVVSPDNRNLELLTSAVATLDVLKNVEDVDSTLFTFSTFLLALASRHKSSKNFLEKISWTEKATLWFNPSVDTMLRAVKRPQAIVSVYDTLGTILEHCGPLLHSGKPSFVSRTLQAFVVDTSGIKPADTVMLALHRTLHKFILSCVAIGANSIFIKGVLKQIINSYLTSWSCLDDNNVRHPFLRVLIATSSGDAELTMLQLLHHVLDNDMQTSRLATAVEILFEWSSSKSKNENWMKYSHFKRPLQKIRPQLRFNSNLLHKTDAILKLFDDLEIVS